MRIANSQLVPVIVTLNHIHMIIINVINDILTVSNRNKMVENSLNLVGTLNHRSANII